jgi:hypothetical protein
VRGDLPLSRAISSGRLEVHGDALKRAMLKRWLNLSPLASIESRRPARPAGHLVR